jgi:hypothetical protein
MSAMMFMNLLTPLTTISYSLSFHSFTDGNTISGVRWFFGCQWIIVLLMRNMYRDMFGQSLSCRIAAFISCILAGPGWTCSEEQRTEGVERESPLGPSIASVVDRGSQNRIERERNKGMQTDGDGEPKNQRPTEADGYVTERRLMASRIVGRANKVRHKWILKGEQSSQGPSIE